MTCQLASAHTVSVSVLCQNLNNLTAVIQVQIRVLWGSFHYSVIIETRRLKIRYVHENKRCRKCAQLRAINFGIKCNTNKSLKKIPREAEEKATLHVRVGAS